MSAVELETPHGLARAHLHLADAPRAALVLGHGAGGSVTAPDLQAVTKAALAEGLSVALVEQPYRVAGRRSAPPAHRLDASWIAVIEQLEALRGLPLAVGGRSSGARVACRTAAATGAAAVVCLAFPLLPPGTAPERTRLPELEAVDVPVLVVQGDRDRFGIPPEAPGRTIAVVRGDHALRTGVAAIAAAVAEWLRTALPATARAREGTWTWHASPRRNTKGANERHG